MNVVCFSLVKMVFGFSSRSHSIPTWYELQHAILRNFGGLDDVKPVEVFAKHLRQIDKDALVCSIITIMLLCSSTTRRLQLSICLCIYFPCLLTFATK